MGNAYALFDSRAPLEEIASTLPKIRSAVQTPSTMELSLAEGMKDIENIPGLARIVQEAKDAGIKYMIKGSDGNLSNEKVSKELSAVMNQGYQSPLYEQGEPFYGDIIYMN